MITSDLLGSVAFFVHGQIDSVRINSNYSIETFERKEVENNTVLLAYIIPGEDFTNVNRIEVMNNGTALTRNDVNIPIAGDNLIRQAINVREVAHDA